VYAQERVVRALDGGADFIEVDFHMREMEKELVHLIEEGRATVSDLFNQQTGKKPNVSGTLAGLDHRVLGSEEGGGEEGQSSWL
jgi:hypothetical protein